LIPTLGERKWPNPPTVEVCVDECGSKCCRTPSFYLPLKPEEEALFEGYPIRDTVVIRDDKIGGKLKGRFFSFQDNGGRCPHLDSRGLCSIYDTRPTCCRAFPDFPTPGCLVWPSEWNGELIPLPSPTLKEELPLEIFNEARPE
jgi:Fe-S-cluster containining protein